MRITQFCQLYSPAIYGGGELLFFQYAKELVRRGHEVNVVTQMLEGVDRFEVIDGVRVHRVGRPIKYSGHSEMSLGKNLSFILKSYKEGLRIARGSSVIHSNTYAPAFSAQLVAHQLRIPHVLSVFDVYSGGGFWGEWSSQSGVSKGLNFIGPLVEKLVLKLRPNLIHTISEASKRDLLKVGVKAPVRVVPCAIDSGEFKVKKSRVKDQFCFVGRHVFYKNVDTVIKAMPRLLRSDPKLKFVVLGDGPMRSHWQSLAAKLGVSSNVLFTGRVSDEHKKRIISESKFLVLPSVQEGFGMVLLEAWALGKPVVVADVPPLNELVNGENGLTVSPYSVSDWVKSVGVALARKRWSVKSSSKRYDIKNVGQELVSLFESL